MTTWRVKFSPSATADYLNFDGSSLKAIESALKKLEVSPDLRGAPLAGNLSGLRKLPAGKTQFRIVYRLYPDLLLVYVIGIGHRRNNEVYLEASTRTGESPSQ